MRNSRRSLLPVVPVVLLLGTAARAHIDAAVFLARLEEHQPSARTYLMGIIEGLTALNQEEGKRRGMNLFCLPRNEVVHPDQVVALIRTYLVTYPEDSFAPVATVALRGLKTAFPCRR